MANLIKLRFFERVHTNILRDGGTKEVLLRSPTKPTGQGTGLGLSYDIVKAYGGELKVITLPADRHGKEARTNDPVGRGEGAEFIIQLPII